MNIKLIIFMLIVYKFLLYGANVVAGCVPASIIPTPIPEATFWLPISTYNIHQDKNKFK